MRVFERPRDAVRAAQPVGSGTRPDLQLTAGLALLLVGLVESRLDAVLAAALGGLAVVVLGAFVAAQARGRSPMLELALSRRRDFVAATLAAAAAAPASSR